MHLSSLNKAYYYKDNVIVFRLMKELNGWVMGHKEQLEKKYQEDEWQKRRKQRKRKKYQPPRKLKAAMKGQLNSIQYHNR